MRNEVTKEHGNERDHADDDEQRTHPTKRRSEIGTGDRYEKHRRSRDREGQKQPGDRAEFAHPGLDEAEIRGSVRAVFGDLHQAGTAGPPNRSLNGGKHSGKPEETD